MGGAASLPYAERAQIISQQHEQRQQRILQQEQQRERERAELLEALQTHNDLHRLDSYEQVQLLKLQPGLMLLDPFVTSASNASTGSEGNNGSHYNRGSGLRSSIDSVTSSGSGGNSNNLSKFAMNNNQSRYNFDDLLNTSKNSNDKAGEGGMQESDSATTISPSITNTTTAVVNTEFPKHGVQLSFVEDFIASCGGRKKLQGLTTSDICETFIKPFTRDFECSYCEFLEFTKHPAVGVATVFISHAWQYQFLDVIEALQHHFHHNSHVVVWFDLFSNNQHLAVDLDFNWWSNTFKTAIQQFGHTVMVFAPWNDPIPLTRAWCLFELYCTVETSSKFEVAMSKKEQRAFFDEIISDTKQAIAKMLATIDVRKSQCYLVEDRERIFRVVQETCGFSHINAVVFERLRDWVISVTAYEIEHHDPDARRRYDLMFALAQLYMLQGKLEFVESLAMECFVQRKTMFGDDNPATLQCRLLLAEYKERIGQTELALSEFIHCNEKFHEHLGSSHPMTLQAMNILAECYLHLGKYEEAEPLYQECLQQRRVLFGEDDPVTLSSLRALALLYQYEGKHSQAEPLYLECLRKRKSILGENHPDTLCSLTDVAYISKYLGKFEFAKRYFFDSLKKRKTLLGPNHPDTLQSLFDLGSFYMDTGLILEAEPYLSSYLDHTVENFGQLHPMALTATSALSKLYVKSGKFNSAYSLLTDCLMERRIGLGSYHPDTLRTLFEIGNVYRDEGMFHEAERWYLECLEYRRKELGDNHIDTLHTIRNLGFVFAKQGKYESATPLLEESLERRTQVLGFDSRFTLNALYDLGEMFFEEDKFVESEPLLKKCLDLRRKSLGDNHIDVFSIKYLISRLYIKQEKFDHAEKVLLDCYQQRCYLLGDVHPESLKAEYELCQLYLLRCAPNSDVTEKSKEVVTTEKSNSRNVSVRHHLSPRDEVSVNSKSHNSSHSTTLHSSAPVDYNQRAEEKLRDCLEKRKKVLGIDHHDTLATMRDLAFLYYKQSRPEAEKLFQEYVNHENVIAGTDNHFLSRIHVLFDLGTFFVEQGKLEDAQRLLCECLDKQRKLQGVNHPSTLQTMLQLGRCYYKAGRFLEAESVLQDCYNQRKEVLGPRHGDTIQTLRILCDFYTHVTNVNLEGNKDHRAAASIISPRQGQFSGHHAQHNRSGGETQRQQSSSHQQMSSLELFLEYADFCKGHFGDDHHETLTTKRGLAINYSKRHCFTKSHPIFMDIYKHRQQSLGESHPDTLESMKDLCNSFADTGDYKDAAFLAKKLVDLLTNLKGADHPDTLQAIHNLKRVSL